MKIYISGISGTGMGPLALMARQAGFTVFGSDLAEGAVYKELVRAGIEVSIGEQDGGFLKEKLAEIDWFVYTSALPVDHPELVLAREAGIKVSKRDELTAFLVSKLGLKMVAVAGTHGKTTTTAMIVFLASRLGLPISYIVGTTLGFLPSGAYHPGDKYFIYEADEYDRNFLKYHPWRAVITTVSYDHPDIYKTREEYEAAFLEFRAQSKKVILEPEHFSAGDFRLAGAARREDAAKAAEAVLEMLNEEKGSVRGDFGAKEGDFGVKERFFGAKEGDFGAEGSASGIAALTGVMDEFPGVGRRFERVAEGVYSDYAHHPEEIMATMDVAEDECRMRGFKGVVAVYQPHQNVRQHEVFEGYRRAFLGASKVFWLPTYLTRENPELRVLEPGEFIGSLENREIAEVGELGAELEERLREYLAEGYLVLMMTAGPADGWLREKFSQK